MFIFADINGNAPPSVLIANRHAREYDRQQLGYILFWEDVDEAPTGVTAVEQYQASLALNKTYDIIIMSDMPPDQNGPNAVKQLRELGFKGYIMCITCDSRPPNANKYLSQGANKVVLAYMSEVHVRQFPAGIFEHTNYKHTNYNSVIYSPCNFSPC